ncbi:MAG: hypothetical protein ACHP84_02585 [Caulobacterales bacterium]
MLRLRDACPIGIDSASALLKSKGISATAFHPESVIAAAADCGRRPSVQLQTVKGRTIVAATAFRHADTIIQAAYAQAHASGAANIDDVIAELRSKDISVDEGEVRDVLREFSEVRFVGDSWFLHRPTNPERDRLRNVTRRMLSVASPVELGAIREGLRRVYRFRGQRGVRGQQSVGARALWIRPIPTQARRR